MKFQPVLAAAAAALAVAAAPATAAPVYSFTATGAMDAYWELEASPTPSAVFGNAFRLDGVTGTLNGSPFTALMEFYTEGGGGGVCADFLCSLFDLYGPTLFSGPTSAPTFLLGSFSMNLGSSTGPNVQLVIADTTRVPAPATLALALAGLALLVAAGRSRAAARA